MTEMLRWLQKEQTTEPDYVCLQNTPTQYVGLTLKSYYRLIYFTNNTTEQQYIGFKQYKITTGILYLIPPYVLYYLPHTVSRFCCISIPLTDINAHQKHILFSLTFSDAKMFVLNNNQQQLLQSTHNVKVLQGFLFEILNDFADINNDGVFYLAQAEAMCRLFSEIVMTHQFTKKDIAQKLGVTPKTINRICKQIFNCTPQFILRYFLLSKCIYLLLYRKDDAINNIAESLGFNETSAFNRFIKSLTDKTPNEIRTIYRDLML